jgi:hypothetical protein
MEVRLSALLSEPEGPVWPEGLGELKSHLIGSETRDPLACCIVP